MASCSNGSAFFALGTVLRTSDAVASARTAVLGSSTAASSSSHDRPSPVLARLSFGLARYMLGVADGVGLGAVEEAFDGLARCRGRGCLSIFDRKAASGETEALRVTSSESSSASSWSWTTEAGAGGAWGHTAGSGVSVSSG